MTGRFRVALTILTTMMVAACIAGVVGHARAQAVRLEFAASGEDLPHDQFVPVMNESQFKRYADVLLLDEVQRMVAEQMLEQYLFKFRERAEEVRDELREIREEVMVTGDWSALGEDMTPLLEGWNAERDALATELLDRIRSLLRNDQLDRWPIFEREKRRADLMNPGKSRLGGEDVDLIALMSERGIEDAMVAADVAAVLDQYAIEMDSALQSRQRVIESLQKDFYDSFGDPERAGEIWNEGTSKRVTVRDINQRYVDLIAGLLHEGDAAWLRRTYEERAYPLAYEDTRADLMFAEVRKLGLSDLQIEQIDAFENDFDMRIEPIRRQLIRQIQEDEVKLPAFITNVVKSESGGRIAFTAIAGPGFGGESEDPMAKLLKDRFQLAKGVAAQVQSVLSAEQQEALPPIRMPESVRSHLELMQFRL